MTRRKDLSESTRSEKAVVVRITLLAVGPDVDEVAFGGHLGAMYEAMIIARLGLSSGGEAIAGLTTYTEHEFDMTAFSSAVLIAPSVFGKSVFDIRKSTKICARGMFPWDISRHRCSI